jgi:protein-tyrosine-phosphatase
MKTKKSKINLAEAKQTHAELEGKTVHQKLSEIIAAKQGIEVEENFGPYRTKEAAEYEDYVRGLSRADLEKHCEKVGVIPSGESVLIAKKLVLEFKRFWQGQIDVPKPVRFSDAQKAKFKSIKF